MKKLRFTTIILTALVASISLISMAIFTGDPAPATKNFDLTARGIPVTVTAPDRAVVKDGLLNGEVDGNTFVSLEIVKDRFMLMVGMWDMEPIESLEDAVNTQHSTVAGNEGFKGFILEEDNGFIYKTIKDGDTDYDFQYFLEKGDRQILFSAGFATKAFTETEVRVLYAAAKAAR